ncbi:hypothetical protein TanjilG_32057 [Lupinus angustifolius]|uniref:Uncharacterized protein n=1 Tax=Lupinus angustifolius TaxID=3871 RepID=A0A4P1RG56_LUPAN|nr:PREDICTED: uncharacterized protein LOC109349897 [Lupinus angustifolius]OIW09908.1 hypothetical protein TanjilG_32057 [Lupinus angustifolius]
MGNCSFKGTTTGECYHTIRVLSDSGDILQFKGPKTVGQVLQHYPGYGIFLQGHASMPLPLHKSLSYGLLYYLLPLKEAGEEKKKLMRVAACDYVEKLSNESSALEVLPSAKNGVWKVKLMIDTRQLEEILSEQVNTEALIEKMRMAATTCSTSSPTRSRIMTTWKVGWKPALGKFTRSNVAE